MPPIMGGNHLSKTSVPIRYRIGTGVFLIQNSTYSIIIMHAENHILFNCVYLMTLSVHKVFSFFQNCRQMQK